MEPVIFLVEKAEEGGYNAKAAGHSIFTQGDSLNEVCCNIQDAIRCHFDDHYPLAIVSMQVNI